MIKSTRNWLTNDQYDALATAAAHPGLWFDRYLRQQLKRDERPPETGSPNAAHVNLTTKVRPAIYDQSYQRWRATLEAMGVRPRIAKTTYRLAAGHGRENPTETGIFLHHSYGVPYIPGSSLKGVAAAFAASRLESPWQPGGDAFKTLFGTTDTAGYVTFMDALPEPGTWKLRPDVITVHHQGYYQGKDEPQADWDSPTPVSFLSVTGDFLIALLPSPGADLWAEAAYEILKMALEEIGVGGKTSSGYGRLKVATGSDSGRHAPGGAR
jgi:CRISPR-associated protein Cmr6